jgi:hypothetical protein
MEKEDLFKAEAVVSEVDTERGGGGANLEGVSSNIYLCMYMYMYMYYGRDRDQGGGGGVRPCGGGAYGLAHAMLAGALQRSDATSLAVLS